jgi:hypothetical protein
MKDEDKQTDSQWLRQQRLESARKAWLWERLKSGVGWIGGTAVALWAGIDAVQKLVEWVTRK